MSGKALLDHIRAAEQGPDHVHAFISLAERGPDEASVGSMADGGADEPLRGVPVAVKDNLATLELPTTCGSRVLEGYRSPFEATAVRRLREAGAWVVGKTNMDEFGMGSSTENSAFGPTLNPRDRSRVPGGSSGGSAAAIAAGYVPAALGSDTGGSVRQPAALCGVVGVKPTWGRVSRYGLVAYASSLDQVGALGRDVLHAAALLDAISGHDPRDATSVDAPAPELVAAARGPERCLVVGVPEEYLPEGVDPDVRAATERAADALRDSGCEVRRISLPHTELAIPCYYVLAPAEASSNLARYDGVRYGRRRPERDIDTMYRETRSRGLGLEVKRRIMLGTYALSAGYYDQYYGAAQRARQLIRSDFARVFADGVDLVLTPTTPGPAFPLTERLDDPMRMYLSDVYTVTANLAGIPAMSLPAGASNGLPLGVQLMAPWWREGDMIAAASAIERRLPGVGGTRS